MNKTLRFTENAKFEQNIKNREKQPKLMFYSKMTENRKIAKNEKSNIDPPCDFFITNPCDFLSQTPVIFCHINLFI
jgi:hypothetical protein